MTALQRSFRLKGVILVGRSRAESGDAAVGPSPISTPRPIILRIHFDTKLNRFGFTCHPLSSDHGKKSNVNVSYVTEREAIHLGRVGGLRLAGASRSRSMRMETCGVARQFGWTRCLSMQRSFPQQLIDRTASGIFPRDPNDPIRVGRNQDRQFGGL